MKMPIAQGNFDTLILAGLGCIGSSLLRLSGSVLASFARIVVVDQDGSRLAEFKNGPYLCRQGSLEDQDFIKSLAAKIGARGILVNLCANVNNVRLRQQLAALPLAYLDSCASQTDEPNEHRFSRIMAHTFSPVASHYPHWLCWGVNPGLVELITRRIIADHYAESSALKVEIYEHDELTTDSWQEGVAASWCPQALIDEVMLSPSLVLEMGKIREETAGGAKDVVAFWQGEAIASRLVAHEEIWNLGRIAAIKEARFLYGLSARAMRILAGDPQRAEALLKVPEENVPLFGRERVAVKVCAGEEEQGKTRYWQADHSQTWDAHGVNAVQWQTAKAMLLAILLLQHSHYGRMAGTFCCSDLPVSGKDWQLIDSLMTRLDINWQEGGHLKLAFEKI
ncbi:hypothetical protein ACUUL3_00555 [Thiovibrio sp. JS02]